MNADFSHFFHSLPAALPIYEALERRLRAEIEGIAISIHHNQITFRKKRNFGCAWLPIRRIKDRPEIHLIVSFVLDHRIEHPRIAEANEPYPNRWTHDVVVADAAEVDEQLMEWLQEACAFGLSK